jgi:predicted Zn-dependent protease with MMP-like domain
MSRQDRLASLLSKGFDYLDAGDIDAAARQLEQARRIDPRHPDVLMLDADVESFAGDPEKAIELYEKVMAARPDDPMPHLSVADVALYSLDDPERALAAADAGIERLERAAAGAASDDDAADDADALLGAQLVRAAALDAHERLDEARAALREIPVGVAEHPLMALRYAELSLEAGDLARATAWLTPWLDDEEVAGDAHHLLGCIHEAADDRPQMIAAWQRTRALDAAEPPPPWHLPVDELEAIAAEAFAELPEEIRARLADVPILIDALPSEDMVAEGLDPRLLGLFQGSPMSEPGTAMGGAPALTNIHLFQTNLERLTDDPEELAEQIRITVLHETAHFFGLDDAALEAMGLG